MKSLLIVLGNQLFDKSNHPQEISDIFMCEDFDLCTYEKHHKKKISFFLTSMREYRDEMSDSGYELHYKDFNDGFESSFVSKLEETIATVEPNKIFIYEIEDKEFESTLLGFLEKQTIEFEVLQSPMFIHERNYFKIIKKEKEPYYLKIFIEKHEKS